MRSISRTTASAFMVCKVGSEGTVGRRGDARRMRRLRTPVPRKKFRRKDVAGLVRNTAVVAFLDDAPIPLRLVPESAVTPFAVVGFRVRRALEPNTDVAAVPVPRIPGPMPAHQPKAGAVGLSGERLIHCPSLSGTRRR